MTQYGIFEDGECIEAGFWDFEEAKRGLAKYDAGAVVLALCNDHEEQPAEFCEVCLETE